MGGIGKRGTAGSRAISDPWQQAHVLWHAGLHAFVPLPVLTEHDVPQRGPGKVRYWEPEAAAASHEEVEIETPKVAEGVGRAGVCPKESRYAARLD